MADSITSADHYRVFDKAEIDLLLVGDVAVGTLADIIQRLFSNTAEITITISDVKNALIFLDDFTFNMIFLKMNSLPTTEELEAIKLIRFGKKKNTHLLFVFIIPENFEDCISGHGADIILTEPLTMEKMSIVLNYWKTFFSKTAQIENVIRREGFRPSQQRSFNETPRDGSTDLDPHSSTSLGDSPGVGQKASLSDSRKSKKISLLHSSKEKLRRERIKECCEQLRTLLPYIKGRKNDAASVLEATVDYVKCIRERIPPAIMVQITKVLQSNRRFCKRQPVASQPFLPSTVMTQREGNEVTSMQSPVKEIRFLANKCLNVYSLPASECPLDEALKGHSSSTSQNAAGDMYKIIPTEMLSLNSLHTDHSVRYYAKVAPSYEAATLTNQSFSINFSSVLPKVSRFPSHYYSSALGQACPQHHKCLHQSLAC
ncbi:spermatogenesis- and oogenesis-specific basic helix-loop-helix-containing protein 2 [Monodelphis domestica]|uniref:spermatogenesis- and oogenesis-specific basic helix-loop-helix-containing protein 2 n=1 Tax=Monodelphis domestica TaxID=13616 RepID=UPI000443221E|nr:spermatogenesis- and oogenesis-specific basic helix-loop-helix-containing protein 2 [Monodelphis domestica]